MRPLDTFSPTLLVNIAARASFLIMRDETWRISWRREAQDVRHELDSDGRTMRSYVGYWLVQIEVNDERVVRIPESELPHGATETIIHALRAMGNFYDGCRGRRRPVTGVEMLQTFYNEARLNVPEWTLARKALRADIESVEPEPPAQPEPRRRAIYLDD